MMEKIHRLTIILILFSISMNAIGDNFNTKNILLSYKDDDLFLRKIEDIRLSETTWQIEYCDINKCELFEMNNSVGIKPLTDFVYLYIVYISHYVDLRYMTENGPPPIKLITREIKRSSQILKNYTHICKSDKEIENALCVMKYTYKNNDIRYYSIAMNEDGTVKKRDEDFENFLTLKRINDHVEWTKKFRSE